MELNKFFQHSEIVEVSRSEIHPAEYNPRTISDESRKMLKKSIKQYGVVGGIIVNRQTGNTIVGGHQKVYILDELNKYDESDPATDYTLRVEVVDIDEKTEKELNITLNNVGNVGGDWDYDKLRALVPDIDYKNAGLTEADLSMIGLDFLFKTQEENDLSNALNDLMAPTEEQHRQEVAARAELREQQREEIRKAQEEANAGQQAFDAEAQAKAEYEAKVQHMKDVKEQVRNGAIENAQNQDAYFMISFDNWENKTRFCETFGLDPYSKFLKGEDLEARLIDGADDSL